MSYTPVPTYVTGDLFTAANANTYWRDNFAAGVPDIFEAAGDLAVGAGENAAVRLAIGAAYQVQRVKADLSGLEYVDGGMFLIEEHLCAADEATIEFTGIPQIFRNLKIIGQGRSTSAAVSSAIKIQFNGDTGNNYDFQLLFGNGITANASEGIAQTQMYIMALAGANASAGCCGQFDAFICNYKGIFNKTLDGIGTFQTGTSSSNLFSYKYSGRWRNTNAVTSILLTPVSGSFLAGSVISLYGVM